MGELDERHAGAAVPLPAHWGGFRLTPERFEFWQHRDNRLHDRLRYTPGSEGELADRAARSLAALAPRRGAPN